MTPLPTNPDVIVVGAGAAGLSAAKALQAKGFDVLTLEAADHVGGRCVTDISTFATPFDRGGSWLHSASINPLARIAEKQGEVLHKADWDWTWVQTPAGRLPDDEVGAYSDYHDRMWKAVDGAGAPEADASVADVLPASPYRDTARHWVAQLQGGDADVVSAVDVHRYAEGEGDWLVAGGLGAFIRRLHADVPVRLNCKVTRIDTSGPGVRVETPDGDVQSKAVVVTVSTGVLAADRIAFAPALPDATREAIRNLPMGLLNKVALDFDPDWAGAHQGEMADIATDGDAFTTILFGFYGGPLAVGFTAGRFAAELEREGPGAATAYVREALRHLFGADIDRRIRATDETAWRANPHTLGSYSYALPSCADARGVLATPIDERLFFAGEATMRDAYSTVHGAWRSGLDVSEKVAAALGRSVS